MIQQMIKTAVVMILGMALLCGTSFAGRQKPYVSAVYGDFSKGFSPTLIQCGTKEMLLSSFVRLYQAIEAGGQSVKLDVYEGMPHVFQAVPGLPEAATALGKVKAFLKTHLENR